MKILLLDKEVDFSNRLKLYLEKKYRDIQVTLCNDTAFLKQLIKNEKYDVILFDSEFDSLDKEKVGGSIADSAFAYISQTHEVVNDTDTLYKYISVSQWYSEICSLYEKKKNRIIKKEKKENSTSTQFITFLPANGGAGSSTMAMACALSLAEKKSVLYINMEQRPSDSVFIKGNSKKCLSDLVSVLKTKYTDTILYNTLSEVIQSGSAVGKYKLSYIKGYNNIMDSLSMNGKYIEIIFNCILKKFDYDIVIIDTDYIVSDFLNALITHSTSLVFVASGSDTSVAKFSKIKRHLEILGREDGVVMPDNYILLNQYYSNGESENFADGMEIIARLARYRTADGTRISSNNILKEVLKKKEIFARFINDEAEENNEANTR